MLIDSSIKADEDFIGYINYYIERQAYVAALDLIDEYELTKEQIVQFPLAGSGRYNYLLPGLRFVSIGRFPFLIFYIMENERVFIIRILHERMDLTTKLTY